MIEKTAPLFCLARKARQAFHRRCPDGARKRALLDALRNRILEGAVGSGPRTSLPRNRPRDRFFEDVGPFSLDERNGCTPDARRRSHRQVSSIHVNGWFGDYDKLATARTLFAERFDLDLDEANRAVVFVGDSPNDGPMFSFFDNSVGVANVQRFPGLQPKFVTAAEAGAGFAELARHLRKGA